MESNALQLTLIGAAIHERIDGHYSDLPFHNRQHANGVTLDAFDLADYCEANGLNPNRLILLLASQYHDAGFYEDLDVSKYTSKEDYSAHIASTELTELGVPSATIEHVASCIRSTERGVACDSLEAKILRRADLANLAGPLGGMILSSFNLYKEMNQQFGLEKGWIEFLRTTHSNIAAYLDEDVSFGDFDRKHDDKSLWLSSVEKNFKLLDTIIRQPADRATKLIDDIMKRAA